MAYMCAALGATILIGASFGCGSPTEPPLKDAGCLGCMIDDHCVDGSAVGACGIDGEMCSACGSSSCTAALCLDGQCAWTNVADGTPCSTSGMCLSGLCIF